MNKVLGRRLFANGGSAFVGIGEGPGRSIEEVSDVITPYGQKSLDTDSGIMMPMPSPAAQTHLRDVESNVPWIVGVSGDMEIPRRGVVDEYTTIGTGTVWDDDYGQEDVAEFPHGRFRDEEGDILDSGVMSLLDDEPPETQKILSHLGEDDELGQGVTAEDYLRRSADSKDTLGELSAIGGIASSKHGLEAGEKAQELATEEAKKHSALGGDPSTFLLDFGLALMASKSPYFMTAVGEAGLVARKSAKERNKERREDKKLKLEEDLLGYKIKKLKEEDTSGMYKSILGKIDKLTPTSQDTVLDAMSNKLSPSDIFPMMKYAEDPSKKKTISNISFMDNGKRVTRGAKEENGAVFVRDPSAEGGWREITDPYIKVNAKAEMEASVFALGPKPAQKEFSEMLTRRGNIITFIAGQRQAENLFREAKESTPLVREVVAGTQSLTEAMPKMWTAITGFATNKNSKTYKERLSQEFDAFFEENPVSSDMANWAGSAEAFKAIMFTQAIKYGAALGHTGKSMSDVDLRGWLAAVGANAKTKAGFWKITSNLEEDLVSTYNTDERMFLKKLDPEDRTEYTAVDWNQEWRDVGQDFGGVVAQRPFGNRRRWDEDYKTQRPTDPKTAPEGSQSSDLGTWRSGLSGAYSSGGRASAEAYLRATPNMSEEVILQILEHLEAGVQ